VTGPVPGLLRVVVAGSLVTLSSCGADDADPPDGYSAEMKAGFVDDCTASGTAEATCACLYDTLEAEVAFERFEEVDRQLRAGATDVPADIEAMAVACAAEPDG
jgi:hypothetical protein